MLLRARLNQDLREVVVVVACGHHVETHQDVERQREHRQIPTTVNRRQGTGHNRAEMEGSPVLDLGHTYVTYIDVVFMM